MGEEGVTDKETGEILVAPEIEIPEDCEHFWRLYFDVSNSLTRTVDGVCHQIPPSEWLAWSTLTGIKIDYDVMRMMDDAFTIAMNRELEERRERSKSK